MLLVPLVPLISQTPAQSMPKLASSSYNSVRLTQTHPSVGQWSEYLADDGDWQNIHISNRLTASTGNQGMTALVLYSYAPQGVDPGRNDLIKEVIVLMNGLIKVTRQSHWLRQVWLASSRFSNFCLVTVEIPLYPKAFWNPRSNLWAKITTFLR